MIKNHSSFLRSKDYFLFLFIVFSSFFSASVFSQTIINSLSELKDHLDDSDGNFKMSPGTYYFNTDNCGDGKLFSNEAILLFTGSNNTFDFTDVTFEFDTEILSAYGSWVVEFWPVGNNNTYLNLTMEDIGMNTPSHGAEAIHLDGADNLIEGFHITVRGSYPYGYGDIFGKGGGSVISHQKHPGVLVRGDRNHIKSCTVIMRAYGHGIFMQGAEDALIEDCYVEGELRTVAEVLEERGTDSPADNVDFLTVWGYYLDELEHDYRFSLQEDGIRCYTTGNIYGTDSSRSTTGTQIKNCEVVMMRSGVTIGWDYTDKVVENCKVIACETGYWFGSNCEAINCSGDASIGPLISEDVGRSNSNIELTLLDNYLSKIGNTPDFYFAGDSHSLTLHDGTTSFNSDITLQVGGQRVGHRWLEGSGEEPLNKSASNVIFVNETKYPVIVESNASNSQISSCGTVTDNGSGNTIVQLTDCEYVRPCSNSADNLQAECFDNMSGVVTSSLGDYNERVVSDIQSGDWISYNNINLTDKIQVTAKVASAVSGGLIEIRVGAETGLLLATIDVPNTTSYDIYEEVSVDLSSFAQDSTVLFFVFSGSEASLFNLDYISFDADPCMESYYNPFLPIGAESFCSSSEVSVVDTGVSNQIVQDIDDGDFLRFSNVDFGYDDVYNCIRVFASAGTNGGTIEVRTDSVDGELLSTVDITTTGMWNQYELFVAYTNKNIVGIHDIFLVFSGEAGNLFNIDNFYFLNDDCSGVTYDAFSSIASLDYCEMYGVTPIDDIYVGGIQDGEWVRYGSVDFGETAPLSVRLTLAGLSTTTGYVNVMLNHPEDGIQIATTLVPATGAWETWEDVLVPMALDVTGVHDIYLYFGNTNFNYGGMEFTDIFVKTQIDPFVRFEAEINDDENGITVISTSDVDGNEDISELNDGDYIMFSSIDIEMADSIMVRAASANEGGFIEIRKGSASGTIISFIDIPSTGGVDTWQTISTDIKSIEGENDIYFVFRGEADELFKLNWLQFTKPDQEFDRLRAEYASTQSDDIRSYATTDEDDDGVGKVLKGVVADSWVCFTDVNLTGAKSIKSRFSTSYDSSYIEVRIGAVDGDLIGEINLFNNDDLDLWQTTSVNITEVEGINDVYLIYKNPDNTYVCYSNWFQFSGLSIATTIDPFSGRIEAEDYSRSDGVEITLTSDVDGVNDVADIQKNDWLLFENVDLTGVETIDTRIASASDGGSIQIRLGSYSGSLLGFFVIPNTGSTSIWETVSTSLYSFAEGPQDVYFVFKGSSDELGNINWFEFGDANDESQVSAPSSNLEMFLYPNPMINCLNIPDVKGAQVQMFDMTGRLIFSSVADNETFSVDVESFTSGIYLVHIIDVQGCSQTYRVIK